MTGAYQLALRLDLPPALTRADFMVGGANRAALAAIEAWPDWPGPVLLLTGPAGSGKTHLVEIWRAASGAAVIAGPALTDADAESFPPGGALAVEDIDRAAGRERTLFHLLNRARESGGSLLLTARDRAASLALPLADLASRLRAAHLAALAAPDEDLLARLLAKLFADRQVSVDPALIAYLLPRMERSFDAARAIVERLDAAALSAGRPITRQLARPVLEAAFGAREAPDPA